MTLVRCTGSIKPFPILGGLHHHYVRTWIFGTHRASGHCRQAAVVAGYVTRQLRVAGIMARRSRSLYAALHPSHPTGGRIFGQVELQPDLCKL